MVSTIAMLMRSGKGILACDESPFSMGKRFIAAGIEPTVDNRRAFFDMLFDPTCLGSISGVILYPDLLSYTFSGEPLPTFLRRHMITPGMRADESTAPLPTNPSEMFTKGIDGLEARLTEAQAKGIGFAKWRAAYRPQPGGPSALAVRVNSAQLAQFVATSSVLGLAAIPEIEIEVDGAHSIDECARATRAFWEEFVSMSAKCQIALENAILKTNMVLPGTRNEAGASDDEIVERTISLMGEVLPHSLGGVVFLSGGLSSQRCLELLAQIVKKASFRWPISFSWGRALWAEPLSAWAGRHHDVSTARDLLRWIVSEAGKAITAERP